MNFLRQCESLGIEGTIAELDLRALQYHSHLVAGARALNLPPGWADSEAVSDGGPGHPDLAPVLPHPDPSLRLHTLSPGGTEPSLAEGASFSVLNSVVTNRHEW